MTLTHLFNSRKRESIIVALLQCNQELLYRMNGIRDSESCIQYFFDSSRDGIVRPNRRYRELMAFWEVYKKFDCEVPMHQKKELWILQMIYEMDCVRVLHQNEKLKGLISEQQLNNLNTIVYEIDKWIAKKYLVLLSKRNDEYKVWKKFTLDRFDVEQSYAERAHVENELIKLFYKGGIAILVVGRIGLTPRRLYGFFMFGEIFERLDEKQTNFWRASVLNEKWLDKCSDDLKGCCEALADVAM